MGFSTQEEQLNKRSVGGVASQYVGGRRAGIVAVSATYTASGRFNHTIVGDATSAAFTVNLPAAATCPGTILCIIKKDVSANAVTIDGNASETINGATTVALSSQYATRLIQSDGSNWFVLAS